MKRDWAVVTPRQLKRLINICLKTQRPIMVGGQHGIGKSTILEQAAIEQGYEVCVIDLSLLEPADLTGLPYRDGDRTRFAKPVILPSGTRRGKKGGLLILEELNRTERLTRQPALQLLVKGTLNDYALPAGWTVAACINRTEEDQDTLYDVDELDDAMLSRFMCCTLVPSVAEWVSWARKAKLNDHVCRFVESNDLVFAKTNPRSWQYLSELLKEAGSDPELIMLCTQAALGDQSASVSFYQFHQGTMGASDSELPPKEADILKRIGTLDTKQLQEIVTTALDELKTRPPAFSELTPGDQVDVLYVESYCGTLKSVAGLSGIVTAVEDEEDYEVPLSLITAKRGRSR